VLSCPGPLFFMDTNNSYTGVKSTSTFTLKPIPKTSVLPLPVNAAVLLADKQQVEPVEIVVGLIHQGTKVVLGGSSKAGKTSVLMQLAYCIACGINFFHWATKPVRVLYLNFEILEFFMTRKLRALVKHFGITDTTNLDIWNLRGKTGEIAALLQQVIKHAEQNNYGIIIIDPIYKLMAGKSENMAGGVSELCLQLERVAERTGAAVIYAHHFTKGKQTNKKPIDRLSGSGVFGRDADSIILLTDHKEPGCLTVDLVLRNLPPQESFVVELQYPVMVEREDLEPESEDGLDNERCRRLLTLLLQQPLTTGEWEAAARLIGIPHASFFRMKSILKDGGHIIQNLLDKTWSVRPELVETRDTNDTTDTGETPANSGGMAVPHGNGKREQKLVGWPSAGAVGPSTTFIFPRQRQL